MSRALLERCKQVLSASERAFSAGDRHYLIKAIEAELAKPDEPSDWHTIESAPRDGRFFLATDGKKSRVVNHPIGCALGEWSSSKSGWHGSAASYFYPTDWMPLPRLSRSKP